MRHISEEKQNNILNAAAEVFAEKGYYQASIQAITQKAVVSTGTFYIYYKSKEEVLLSLYHQFSAHLDAVIKEKLSSQYADSTEKLIACTAAVVKVYATKPKLSLIMLTKIIGMSKLSENEYYNVFNQLCQVFQHIIAAIRSDRSEELYIFSIAYIQLLNALTAQWIASSDQRSLADLIDMIITYNFRALQIPVDEEIIRKHIIREIERENER